MSLFLGEGYVYHSRKVTSANQFSYPSFFIFFSCENENTLQQSLRENFFLSLKSEDYLNSHSGSFKENISRFLKENCHYDSEEVWLHTMPRMFGYAFNPVSFWVCKRKSVIEAVLVEVHNTFNERHFYWIKPEAVITESVWYRAEKVFHVSPFFPVDGYYQFQFQFKETNSRVDINYYSGQDELRLATWVLGQHSDFREMTFLRLFFKYGWMTPMIVIRIHWQAFRLWKQKVPFFNKPKLPVKEVS